MTREDYLQYYIQGSDHYLIPKDIFDELFNEMDNWKKEVQLLKDQLNYLRSGEYINQLKFERDMLQYIVDNGEVQEEDKKFIDMTHRNTELLEENQELKKLVIAMEEVANKYKEVIDKMNKYMYSGYLINSKEIKNILKEVK